MIRTIKTVCFLALAGSVGACGAPERADGPMGDPQADPQTQNEQAMAVGADTLDQGIRTFQTGVEQAIRESEQTLERSSTRIQAHSEEAWREISERAESTWEAIRTDVQGLVSEDNGRELERSREEAARSLAELHGDLVRSELETSREARDFRESARRHLRSLENDVNELDRVRTERQGYEQQNGVEEFRERIDEVLRTVEELDMLQEQDFNRQRDELAEEIGDLTRDIREHKYQAQWTGTDGMR